MFARLGAIAIGVLLAASLLVLAELSLRLLGVAAGTPRHDPFSGFGTTLPMFERVDADTWRIVPRG
ncbi:MAG TPA: hypothetical protein VMW19_14760 [Myxococcota bacterium]|nr:hypothetical protein [Myxococcota bacterium]